MTQGTDLQRETLRTKRSLSDVRLEPLPRLEWSLAMEANPGSAEEATSPAALRCSWIHRAPEDQVVELYRKLGSTQRELPAPWWLKALDRAELPSRAAAFEIEDDVHALLTTRPGWVFVPWGAVAEAGYWEYGPSDREPMTMPTTVVLTDQHPGWINVVPAHSDSTTLPLPINGVTGLASALAQIETW